MCKGCICIQPFTILEGVLNCEIKTRFDGRKHK